MTKLPKLLVRILCMTLCLSCVMGLALPAGAVPEISKMYPQYIYTSQVYSRASDSASVIGQLESGTQVTVLGVRGDYYKIDCYGMTGYIAISQVEQIDEEYYVKTDTDAQECGSVAFKNTEALQELQESILALAQEQLGDPYVPGGTQPGGFDCSGFAKYIYGQHGYSLHRVVSAQMQDGLIVDKEDMQVGDLVFFREPGTSGLASHVGIYVGDNQIIHADNRGIGYANLDGVWFAPRFFCARRIVTVDPAEETL